MMIIDLRLRNVINRNRSHERFLSSSIGGHMADSKKTILKEISLWKKRYNESKKVLRGVYQDVSREAKKAYKQVAK